VSDIVYRMPTCNVASACCRGRVRVSVPIRFELASAVGAAHTNRDFPLVFGRTLESNVGIGATNFAGDDSGVAAEMSAAWPSFETARRFPGWQAYASVEHVT